MFSKLGRRLFAGPVNFIVSRLQSTGITPNALTLVGFALTALSGIFLALGNFRIGGLILLLASFFDMLDGSLARTTGRSTTFGAFLDSTLDRYAESVTFLALAIFYSGLQDARTQLILIVVLVVGSLMVSYTRARAEGLNIECKVGLLQRPERIILLIAGLLTGWMLPVLWVLAVLTNFTALQRIVDVYSKTRPNIPVDEEQDLIQSRDNVSVN